MQVLRPFPLGTITLIKHQIMKEEVLMDIFDQRIIGYDSVKATIRQINDILKAPEKYRAHGAELPHGLLLVGSPGTGKSTLCHCLMRSCGRQAIIFRRDAAEKEFMEELQRAFEPD